MPAIVRHRRRGRPGAKVRRRRHIENTAGFLCKGAPIACNVGDVNAVEHLPGLGDAFCVSAPERNERVALRSVDACEPQDAEACLRIFGGLRPGVLGGEPCLAARECGGRRFLE